MCRPRHRLAQPGQDRRQGPAWPAIVTASRGARWNHSACWQMSVCIISSDVGGPAVHQLTADVDYGDVPGEEVVLHDVGVTASSPIAGMRMLMRFYRRARGVRLSRANVTTFRRASYQVSFTARSSCHRTGAGLAWWPEPAMVLPAIV